MCRVYHAFWEAKNSVGAVSDSIMTSVRCMRTLGSGEQLEVKRLKNERDRISKLQAENIYNTAATAARHLSR